MRLFWSTRSPFARKAMVVAHESGVATRIECVATLVKGDAFNADYVKTNPTGQLPALELDDGTVLFDSDVICEYLDTTFGGERLLPRAPAQRFSVLRRQSLGNGIMDRGTRWLGETFRPEAQRSSAVIDACRLAIGTTLDALEQDAATAHAERFDMGDAAAGCALSYLDFRFAEVNWRNNRPHLTARHSAYAQRPSFRQTEYVSQ